MKFVLNKPVQTNTPTVVVDGKLAVGISRFRLEVIDESGKRSKNAEIDVLVSRSSPSPQGRDGFGKPILINPAAITESE